MQSLQCIQQSNGSIFWECSIFFVKIIILKFKDYFSHFHSLQVKSHPSSWMNDGLYCRIATPGDELNFLDEFQLEGSVE